MLVAVKYLVAGAPPDHVLVSATLPVVTVPVGLPLPSNCTKLTSIFADVAVSFVMSARSRYHVFAASVGNATIGVCTRTSLLFRQ
jgi:hypothetical protein